MATFRYQAFEDVLHRQPKDVVSSNLNISTIYGERVFHFERMKEYLTGDAYKSVQKAVEEGTRIDRKIADQVASAMKDWAVSQGVTHYTHWFQPMTGSTAEKHDSFFQPVGSGKAINKFEGSLLVQQEPDASSFPHGGIRNTFEARGYTAWDPTSPAFIIEQTLCIPTIFISYTGEALDYKMPLLKALHEMDKAATDVCKYFDKNVKHVNATLGWEQEYFLIDKALYNARPDIMMTGRALFGHGPAKGQQLDDHYFGSIPERIHAFMRDFETESIRLGIPVTTRHNEVAPNQFECAPIFEECNLANDHNLLLMDIMSKVARKHDFRVLFHEKPFAGLNGSGKHNNWSLSTDTGVNLLQPGNKPKSNLQFLTFFINTIQAINDHADLLRASIASASNDHRLGANEAPPAIMSVFIGSQLTEMLNKLEKSIKEGKMTPEEKTALKLSIGNIPEILIDNTDRNRTSPFAFTGNKFEFRAVGSTANCSGPMMVLNTIVTDRLKKFKTSVDKRIKNGNQKEEAILKELQALIKSSKKIRFEGNGYGEEWMKEAEKRGLSNLTDTPRALAVYKDKKAKKPFIDLGVFSERELDARTEIEYEKYILKLQIEARMFGDIMNTHVVPAAIKYQNVLLENVQGMKSVLGDKLAKESTHSQLEILSEVSTHLNQIKKHTRKLIDERKKANKIDDLEKKAFAYCDKVKVLFEPIKYHSDKLELLIADEFWPVPKLREILFTK